MHLDTRHVTTPFPVLGQVLSGTYLGDQEPRAFQPDPAVRHRLDHSHRGSMNKFELYVDHAAIAMEMAEVDIVEAYGYMPDDLNVGIVPEDSDLHGITYIVTLEGPLALQVAEAVNEMQEPCPPMAE